LTLGETVGFGTDGDLRTFDFKIFAVNNAEQKIRRAQEFCDVFGFRLVVNVERRPDLLDARFVQNRDAVAEFERFFLIVRDENRRHTEILEQSANLAAQTCANLRVKRGKRLVEQ
jgi:hypothetical protein